jgi:BASS family bile acid:Na+ symporter
MAILYDVLLPMMMFFMMAIIGTELSIGDFRRVADRPGMIACVTAGQLFLLPALVTLVLLVVEIPVVLAVGLLVMASGPGGGLSNILTSRVGGNVALSVALTTTGSLACLVSMPLVFAMVFPMILSRHPEVTLPLLPMVMQLVVFLMVPVVIGMWFRHRWADWVISHHQRLHRINSLLLLGVIVFALSSEGNVDWGDFFLAIPYGFLFLAFCGMVGWCFSRIFCLDAADSRAVIMEYTIRSAAVPTLVLVGVMKKLEWLVFPGATSILQLLLAITLVIFSSRLVIKEV